MCGAVNLLPPYGVQLTPLHYILLRLKMCGAETTASIRYTVDRSTLNGSEYKNVWSRTSTAAIRCAIDRSTVSGFLFKNVWLCDLIASNGGQLTDQTYLLLRLQMCEAVPPMPPYSVQLTVQIYLVLRLRMCGAVLLMSPYVVQLSALNYLV